MILDTGFCYIEAKLGTDVGTSMVQKCRIKVVIFEHGLLYFSPRILTHTDNKEQQSFKLLKLIWE